MMKFGSILLVIVVLCLTTGACAGDLPGQKRDFAYKWGEGVVDVSREGKVVARYVYKDTAKPYMYPVLSPRGVKVTRAFPIEKVAGEATDHPHQRSFWIGHGDVNGIDFWTEGEKCGKIVQTSIDFTPPSPGYWAIHTTDDWVAPDGKKICSDERYITFLSCDYGTVITTLITISAADQPVKLGDTKEGFLALRVAQGMQVLGGTGHIMNSQGDKDQDAWGKSAKWCDYTGEIDSQTVGIAVFDAPDNHGYPTFWQVQDYGLFAANPFGGGTFSRDPKKTTAKTIDPYAKLTLRYVVLVHDGKLDADTLKTAASQLVGEGPGATAPVMRFEDVGKPTPPAPEPKPK